MTTRTAKSNQDWDARLRPILLNAEPVRDQLQRRKTGLIVLSLVAFGAVSIIFGLFSLFRRPDIGGLLAMLLLTPVLAVAWFDFALLQRRVNAYCYDQAQRGNDAS